MVKVYGWHIRRAGTGMTITHVTGKITNIEHIGIENGVVVATAANGKRYELTTV